MTQRRTSVIELAREAPLSPNELEPFILSQSDINIKLVNNTCCQGTQSLQLKIPFVNKIMTFFGILIGLLMFSRGLLDGGLSMIGLWLRLIYFGILSVSYAIDNRLEEDRWSFLTPALSGLLLTIAQLTGMFVIDGPFECDSFSTCL